MRKRVRKGDGPAYWGGLLEERERSGMSLAAFARARGINRNTLLWWRYELRRRGHGDISGGLRQVRVVDGATPAPGDDGFEVRLSTGDVVYAPRGFDESALARLLAVLRR
jgi:hypothetical protein